MAIMLAGVFAVSIPEVYGQKVTLVLSGGGSFGAGHIGVIRALEENGIPIDCIVGTSAGAVVGGFYSIGFTPDEIEEIMSSVAFQRWAEGKIDDENVFYFQNDDLNASWLRLNLDPRKKFSSSIPTNLFSTDQMDFKVMTLCSQANAVANENFDNLFIPFRCVVSDVSHSKPVILKSGNLGRAIRGSMSIPFVYQPIVIDSTLYYDGGIYENFPNEAAISEFDPDMIIGSKVTKSSRNASLDEPVLQVLHLLQTHQSDSIPFSPSVLIKPGIPPKLGMLDFSETKRLADSGYVATMRKMPEIRSHMKRIVKKEEIDSARAVFKRRFPEFIIDSIKILGIEKTQASNLEKALYLQGTSIDVEDLEPQYFRLLANGNITSMFPLASYDTLNNAFDLDIEVHKSNPLSVKVGGNLSFSTFNVGFAEARYNPTLPYPAYFRLNGYFGQSYGSLMASGRVYFNHPKTWFLNTYFVYNRYSFYNSTAYFYDVQQRSSITDKIITWNLHAGIPVGNDALIRVGASYSIAYGFYYLSDLFETSDTLTRTQFGCLNPAITYDFNKLDRKQYASAGTHVKASVSVVSGNERVLEGAKLYLPVGESQKRFWLRATGLYEHYFRIAGPVSGGTHLELNVSTQPLFYSYISTLTYSEPFQPLPESKLLFLPGYRAPSWGAAGLKILVKLTKEIELRSEAYVFQPYKMVEYDEYTHAPYYAKEFKHSNFITATTLVWNSMLGPLSIGLNHYSSSNDKLIFNINFGYILFNPGRPD